MQENSHVHGAAVSYLDGLLEGPIQFLFYFLLQEARGFRLLHSGGRRLETAVVARRVAFVHLRSELLVDADDDHTCGGGSQSDELDRDNTNTGSDFERVPHSQQPSGRISAFCV